MTVKLSLDDEYFWRPEYKKIPERMLNIPGLHVIGHSTFDKAGEELVTHYHNCMEIVVVINGSQQYVVDGNRYLLYGGDMFVTTPKEIHGNGELPQDVCEFIWLQLDLTATENFLGLTGENAETLLRGLSNNSDRTIAVDGKDIALITDAWHGLASQKREKQLWGCACLSQFLYKYFCVLHRGGPKVSEDIQEALRYINNHLLENVRINAIADEIGMSASRFKAKFRQQLGITPLTYITSRKMEIAKQMLRHSTEPVTQIAFQLSFSSSNYFSTVFRQYTGFTPTEFRANARKKDDTE